MLSSHHRVSFLHTVLLIAVVRVFEAIVTFWLGSQNYDPHGPKRNKFHTTPDNSVAKYRKLALIFKESALLEATYAKECLKPKVPVPQIQLRLLQRVDGYACATEYFVSYSILTKCISQGQVSSCLHMQVAARN